MVQPCCPKCESTDITYDTQTFRGHQGILVYCGACGAIISWSTVPG